METRISSGTSGLDEVLHGGFVPERNYLIRGGLGVGKTLLGRQFLAEGLLECVPTITEAQLVPDTIAETFEEKER